MLATILHSTAATYRGHALAVAAGAYERPGVLSANAVTFAVLGGAGFGGASVALWLKARRDGMSGSTPWASGLKGYFLGLSLPLLYALGRDLSQLHSAA